MIIKSCEDISLAGLYVNNDFISWKELIVRGLVQVRGTTLCKIDNLFGKLVIASGIEYLRCEALMDCYGLTDLVLPSSIKRIDWRALKGCNLTVHIPDDIYISRMDLDTY